MSRINVEELRRTAERVQKEKAASKARVAADIAKRDEARTKKYEKEIIAGIPKSLAKAASEGSDHIRIDFNHDNAAYCAALGAVLRFCKRENLKTEVSDFDIAYDDSQTQYYTKLVITLPSKSK